MMFIQTALVVGQGFLLLTFAFHIRISYAFISTAKCYGGWPRPTVLAPVDHRSARTSSTVNRMFTGIVEEMGTVVSLQERSDMTLWDGSQGTGTELVLQAEVVLDGAYLGCSIAVSGVCLTVTALQENMFTVGLSPETLRRTYLADLKAGDQVNLERASLTSGRNSGHFVQGHVDGTGQILEQWQDQDSLFFKIHVPHHRTSSTSPPEDDDDDQEMMDMMPYIVPKGFIAVDGTSLTVIQVDPKARWFTFMLVAYTQTKIIQTHKRPGDLVNLEVDVLGKYAQQALTATLLPRIQQLEQQVADLQQQVESLQKQQEYTKKI